MLVNELFNSNSEPVIEGVLDNPGQEDSPVASAIIRRILLQRTDLLSKYGPERVGAAVDDVADSVGDWDEIGSSDVSGWVRRVEQMLGDMQEGVAEGVALPDISGLGYNAQSLIMKLRRDVEEKRIHPTPQAVLAAARELAGDMEFAPQLLVKQVLGQGVAEGDISQLEKDVAAAPVAPIANMEAQEKIGGRHDADDFDSMVSRLKKLAGAGPMKTVYDPNTRRYKNMPTAVQPPQQPKK
jgi:hypothetical protein